VSQDSIKQRLGVIPQDNGLDIELTLLENLKTFCWYYDIKSTLAKQRIPELVEELKLREYSYHTLDQLNPGLRKRAAIARALLHRPEILIFDEPTTGLDGTTRLWLWNYVLGLKKQNRTVILATQSVSEVEALCDRVAIMDEGKILTIGSPKELIFDKVGSEVLEFTVKPSELNYYLEKYRQQGLVAKAIDEDRIMLCFKKVEDTKKIVHSILSDEIIIRRPTLNDVFLMLVGSHLREEI